MSTREISETIKELYDVDVSATLISNVTARVINEVSQWQNRPLDAVYPVVFMDCIWVFGWQKMREPSSGYRF